MRVDFDRVICNLKGLPMIMDGEPLTVKFVAVTALLNTYPDERGVDAAEKARRYWLAKAIESAQDLSLSPTECELIKTLVGKTFGPPIVGPLFEAFSPVIDLPKALEETMQERAEAGLDELPKRKRGRA